MKKQVASGYGGRPQVLHDRITTPITFERDRLRDFQEQCVKAGISVSEGVRQLVEQELEKKALGESRQEANPCSIAYSTYTDISKKDSVLGPLDQWIHLTDAIQESKKIPEDQLYILQAISTNTEKAYRWRKTGKVQIS